MSSTISREETEILTRKEKLLQISTQPKLTYLLPIWEWTPSRATHETNVYHIGNTIAKEAQTSFQQIGFVDWVQIALGNSVESLNHFDFNLQVLGWCLYAYFLRHQSELKKYSDVE